MQERVLPSRRISGTLRLPVDNRFRIVTPMLRNRGWRHHTKLFTGADCQSHPSASQRAVRRFDAGPATSEHGRCQMTAPPRSRTSTPETAGRPSVLSCILAQKCSLLLYATNRLRAVRWPASCSRSAKAREIAARIAAAPSFINRRHFKAPLNIRCPSPVLK